MYRGFCGLRAKEAKLIVGSVKIMELCIHGGAKLGLGRGRAVFGCRVILEVDLDKNSAGSKEDMLLEADIVVCCVATSWRFSERETCWADLASRKDFMVESSVKKGYGPYGGSNIGGEFCYARGVQWFPGIDPRLVSEPFVGISKVANRAWVTGKDRRDVSARR
ncbi:hypothetical protein L208DRAFT_1484500 [Tricholoma matsutake]|nr:hypothetical protein L208DRAFT_1484500 [Tricholoma matsutake 945]